MRPDDFDDKEAPALDERQRDLLLYSSGELDADASRRLEEQLLDATPLQDGGTGLQELRRDAEMLALMELGLGEVASSPRRVLPRWIWGGGALLAAAALVVLIRGAGPPSPDSAPAVAPRANTVVPALSTSSQRLLRELRSERGPMLRPPLVAAASRTTPVRSPHLPARSRVRASNPSLDAFLNLRRSK